MVGLSLPLELLTRHTFPKTSPLWPREPARRWMCAIVSQSCPWNTFKSTQHSTNPCGESFLSEKKSKVHELFCTSHHHLVSRELFKNLHHFSWRHSGPQKRLKPLQRHNGGRRRFDGRRWVTADAGNSTAVRLPDEKPQGDVKIIIIFFFFSSPWLEQLLPSTRVFEPSKAPVSTRCSRLQKAVTIKKSRMWNRFSGSPPWDPSAVLSGNESASVRYFDGLKWRTWKVHVSDI